MFLEHFLGIKPPIAAVKRVAAEESLPSMGQSFNALCAETYAIFLNDYIAQGFNEHEGDQQSQGHFYGQALQLAKAMEVEGRKGNLQLEASECAEQQRQKARRNYRQLKEIAESVLIDQRNYLLACIINAQASKVGCAVHGRPYSGIDTRHGQPSHAFAHKLMADAALGRGFAAGLQEDAVMQLEQKIAVRAEQEMSHFIKVFEAEERAQP